MSFKLYPLITESFYQVEEAYTYNLSWGGCRE